ARWEVPATVLGEVTDTGRLEMRWRGDVVVDIPPASAAEGPLCERPAQRPPGQDVLNSDDPGQLAGAGLGPGHNASGAGERLLAELLAVLGSAAAADKTWVTEQYDKDVRGNTGLAAPHEAGGRGSDEGIGLVL